MSDPSIGTREERAWAAGFFDGEGSIGCYGNHHRGTRISMTVEQKHGSGLERFRQAIGGLGKIDGPHGKGPPGPTAMYRWRTHNFGVVQTVLGMLWPFLGPVKRAQARRAIEQHRGIFPRDYNV